MLLRRNRFIRMIQARPRLIIVSILALVVARYLPESLTSHFVTRCLIGWNTGTCLYVFLATSMMMRSSQQNMRRRALLQDDGKWILLILVIITSLASLVAIAAELAVVKDLHGPVRIAHIALAGLTVVSSWAFIQIMFALHYAHDFYASRHHGQPAGLQFPDDDDPDYGDFFYFAAVIGTSGQTADVSFTTKAMRRIGTLHCVLAYLFNTTVLALLINIGASLF